MAEADAGQVPDAIVDTAGIGADVGYDPVELAQLREQNSSAEFVHAEVAAHKPIELRPAELLLVQVAQTAEVVEADGPLEGDRVVGDDRAAFPGGDGLIELQTIDPDIRQRSDEAFPCSWRRRFARSLRVPGCYVAGRWAGCGPCRQGSLAGAPP